MSINYVSDFGEQNEMIFVTELSEFGTRKKKMTLTDKELKVLTLATFDLAKKGILLPKLRKDLAIKQASQTKHRKAVQLQSGLHGAPFAKQMVDTTKRVLDD